MGLKDRALHRDQVAKDLDFRCGNLEQENMALADENEELRRKAMGLKQTSDAQIRALEGKVRVLSG